MSKKNWTIYPKAACQSVSLVPVALWASGLPRMQKWEAAPKIGM
jgi:hypothetical protein